MRKSWKSSPSPRSARSRAAASPRPVARGAKVRLIRDNVVIHEGDLSHLNASRMTCAKSSRQECGMAFTNYQDMQKGDVIECYRVEQIQRSL